jgi:protoheme IX farnesyltransferase
MSARTAGQHDYLRVVLELTKARITAAVTLTTATGYLLAAHRFEYDMWLPLVGVFVLASGSAALNQWQERNIDARMKRTRGRPIPSGRIDPNWALFISVALILLGFSCLTSIETKPAVITALGAFALVWYNGVYTPLKRVTAFAVVPGALIGAVPPCIGYAAAGGEMGNPEVVLLACFFFIWQIPHFWLLLLMLGGEYSEAGLPTATERLSPPQLARITFVWILATAVSGLAFPVLERAEIGLPWSLGLVAASIWLAAKATRVLRIADGDAQPPIRGAFRQVNVFALMVMVCLSASALLA